MNNTNRPLNRLLIGVAGVVLLAVGAAAVLLALVDTVRQAWSEVAPGVIDTITGWFEQTPLGDSSWLWLVVAALCLLAIILLLVFIFRQGHGRTATLIERTSPEGSSVVAAGVAEQALEAALAKRSELVSSNVSTFLVRGRPVLKVAATARRGVSPRDVADLVEGYVRAFDRLLGEEIPVLIHLGGGFRTRTTAVSRLD